jgi:hypothetical protein
VCNYAAWKHRPKFFNEIGFESVFCQLNEPLSRFNKNEKENAILKIGLYIPFSS